LEHSDPRAGSSQEPRPLLVTGQYGGGRSVYMGFNGTWRWRRLGRDGEYFSKFWVQTVRYLIEGRLLGSQKRGVLEIPKDRYAVGEKIVVMARLKGPQGEALADPAVPALLHLHGDKSTASFPLRPVKDKPGEYQGEVEARRQGPSFVTVEVAGIKPGERVTLNSKNFRVEFADVELEDRTLNKQLLRDIAERSSNQYRGAYFEVDELARLAAALPDRNEIKAVPGRPIELWDTNRLLFLIALLLTIEWGARKRFKLL
jgi:hypothetical protein